MRRFKTDFILSIVFIITASISLLCIPLINMQTAAIYFVAIAFWLSVILQQVFFWKCNQERKQIERKRSIKRPNKKKRTNRQKSPNKQIISSKQGHKVPIGITAFFKNKEAAIADSVLIISALVTVLLIVLRSKTEWLIIISVTLLFLSFKLHCILNGRNYKWIRSEKN